MDEQKERYSEPVTPDTTPTGTHGAGNYIMDEGVGPLPDPSVTEIWIEQEDQAKQGKARKFNFKRAQAAPDRPHIGHVPGSGESQ
ncbi:MAG TPA: hypothetical protein VGK74_01800 [Symbiobacteriaceae bacterium]|jgi:hypothetical protein